MPIPRDESQQAYTIASGYQSTNYMIVDQRDPNVQDVNYNIGRFWQNQVSKSLWFLNSLSNLKTSGNPTGQTQALWVEIFSGSGAVTDVKGDDNQIVTPDAFGVIQFIGATPGNSVNAKPVFFKKNATSVEELDVQISAAIASTNVTKIGLAAFNSAQFTVDANGFVSMSGSGAVTDLTGDDGLFVIPTANNINLTGVTVNSGTHAKPVFFLKNATSTMELDVQVTTNSGGSTKNNAGLASFQIAQFAVDANGFVALAGSGTNPAIQGVHPDAHTAPGTDPVIADSSGNITIEGGATYATNTRANPIRTNSLAAHTLDLEIQLAGSNAATAAANKFGVAQFDADQFTVTDGYVQLSGGTTGAVLSLSDDVSAKTSPDGTGNIQLVGHVNEQLAAKFSTITAGTYLLNINPMSPARWIVDPLGFNGTHTTIASAIASATNGDTIFLLPGLYTENLTLKIGVNISAFMCDSLTPNVIIQGTCTFTGSGTVTLSGINLQTNGASAIVVSGSSASILNLVNCYLNCVNATGVTFSTSNSSAEINLYNCNGNVATTGISYFASTSPGQITVFQGFYDNTGLSTTSSTSTLGAINAFGVEFFTPFTFTGTSGLFFNNVIINTFATNTTAITYSSSVNSSAINYVDIDSGSGSSLFVSATDKLNVEWCHFASTATNVVDGTGTIKSNPISFLHNTTVATSITPIPIGPILCFGTDSIQILEGSSSPNGVVTAPKGSLFLRTDGSSSSTRAYINTDSGTTWTNIVTAV